MVHSSQLSIYRFNPKDIDLAVYVLKGYLNFQKKTVK